jgi:Tol biopolymer transport system component
MTNRGGAPPHLVYSTRKSLDAAWAPVQALFPSGAWDDWSVSVSADGRTAIVASDRGGNSDLYVATRDNPLATFGPLSLAAGTNSAGNEEGPRWSADGKTLYFDSTRDGKRHIYRVGLVGSGFGTPEAVTELNTSDLEASPVLAPDELTIYFLSGRSEPNGDIYVATRAAKDQAFGDVKPLEGVNSAAVDAPGWISPDGCTLYLSSTRAGGGSFDIYVARRPR